MKRSFDPVSVSAHMADAAAHPGQPQPLYQAAEDVTQEILGHELFTVLAFHAREGQVERMHSSRPGEYPLLGRKLMGPTPWGERVLRQGRTWCGLSADDIRWAFPDHELILSLGCENCLNAPIRYNGRVLGAISVLGAAGSYVQDDVEVVAFLAPFLVPALLPPADPIPGDQR